MSGPVNQFLPNPDFSGNNNSPDVIGSHSDSDTSLNYDADGFGTNTGDILVADDRSEILTWLSPLDPNFRHHDVQMRRVDDIGDWLLRTGEFQSWYGGHGQGGSQKAAIFCSGNPGVGKTYISSLVIDTLRDGAGKARGEDIAVACFYFDFAAQREQSATSVLGALLKQVVDGCNQIPREITDAFEKQENLIGGRRLQLPEIVKMLGNLACSYRTFLCFDAMDECTATDRGEILLALGDIIKKSPATRVFMTGRPQVGGEVERHLPSEVGVVSISPPKDDFVRYVHTKLAGDTAPDGMDENLEAEIVEKIPGSASEIFLLTSLSLDAILQETTIHRRRERLRVITNGWGLEDAYGATLDRIKAQEGQKSRLGVATLMWICHSEQPLSTESLCHALAVEMGSTDYNADSVSSISTVLGSCQGLVVADKEGSGVRLIHHTLQEYLTSHPDLFRNPHAVIAETCLTYLNSQLVMMLTASDLESAQHRPFLKYSAVYWGTHMLKELSKRGQGLALRLFSHYERHISVKLLLECILRYSLRSIVEPYKFTGLHCASFFGLVELAKALIEIDGADIDCMDDIGTTPLVYAADNGHEAVVKLFLGRDDVNPNRPDDRYGLTPISWAADNGHEAVVRLLLGRKEVIPDRPDKFGRTPILLAAENGYEVVVKLLLEREDVRPDRPDAYGRTPISRAASNGHDAVVKLLLGQEDVNPDRLDKFGKTPILLAAENGNIAVVKLLLGRKDVNPDRPDDQHGQTPISWAAENGHEAVVGLLLEREDVSPDKPGNSGRTPISWAAEYGHEAVVKLLLGRKDVNPDRQDKWGQTAMECAAYNGHEAVVKLLLGRQEVDPDQPDHAN